MIHFNVLPILKITVLNMKYNNTKFLMLVFKCILIEHILLFY